MVRFNVFILTILATFSGTLYADSAGDIITASGIKGGFVVHVGCGNGTTTAALRKNKAFIVHGLDTNPANVQKAREHILAGKHNGTVSVAEFGGTHLPYVDNMVNFMLCTKQYDLSDQEIMRVLAPRGKAIIQTGNKQRTITKPWPDNYDEWNHYLRNPDNNAVSKDTAIKAPITHLQWKAGPMYSRHHDKSVTHMPALASARGKIFYIIDNGPRASVLWPANFQLTARDAFNGVVLWQKDIEQWIDHLAYGVKQGPAVNTRRLVAVGDYVYVTMGVFAPVSKLDANTGKVVKVYKGTEKTEEILVKDGVVYLVINPSVSDQSPKNFILEQDPKIVMAVKESDGTILWQNELSWIAPSTLTLGESNVYLCNGPEIIACNRKTGKQLWKSQPLPWRQEMPTYFAPTLVAVPGALLYVGGENWYEHAGSKGLMTCLNATTGKIKWQQPHLPSGYQSPQDIFVIDGYAWCGSLNSKPGEFDTRYPEVSPSTGEFISYNIETGEPGKTIPRGADCYWFHHRCHRAKATENFFMTSRTGIEMIDNQTGQWSLHHWIRGACLYGIMPANGLIYAPPHPCACYPEAKLTGFNAVSGPRNTDNNDELSRSPRLVKGPAYNKISNIKYKIEDRNAWPTYRANPARSGSTDTAVRTDLRVNWQTKVADRLTQPIAADGKIFVAATDQHSLHAIDQQSGKKLWKYIAGGRIDSPPTFYKGMLLFGSADGYVYCLRASDGALAWRFRAAPYDRRMMFYEQLESVWPVHGSILIRNDIAYIIAGRSMFLDGGLTLYRLSPLTGKLLSSTKMDDKDPAGTKDFHDHVNMLDMPVASSDILSSEGDYLFMRSQPFDLQGKRHRIEHVDLKEQQGPDAHLFVPNGFLDDQWWHRSFWVYGRSVNGGPAYWQTGNATPSGKIMVLDEQNLYAFGRRQDYWKWTVPTEYRLYCVDRTLPKPDRQPAQSAAAKRKAAANPKIRTPQFKTTWSIEMPVLVRAMAKTSDTIFAAGPRDIVNESDAYKKFPDPAARESLKKQADLFTGKDESVLWAVSAKNGTKLKEIKLNVMPVFDGLIAANGKLYMSTTNGKIISLK